MYFCVFQDYEYVRDLKYFFFLVGSACSAKPFSELIKYVKDPDTEPIYPDPGNNLIIFFTRPLFMVYFYTVEVGKS